MKVMWLGTLFQLPNSVLKEAWLLTGLTIELIFALGSRLMWLWMAFRFFCYISLLAIPLWRCAFIFCLSDYIERNIKYGPNPRNFLDIYYASNNVKHKNIKHPVVIFLTGGAWIIGYKGWGAFMGMLLAQMGVVFVSVDYRNFPQGTISNMMEDTSNAIEWVFKHISIYNGDPNNIHLITQSAGAHIGSLTILSQAYNIQLIHYYTNQLKLAKLTKNINDINIIQKKLYHLNNNINKWNPCQLSSFIGISGAYNMIDMKDYLNSRGLYLNIMEIVLENNLEKYSPIYQLHDLFKPKIANNNNEILLYINNDDEDEDEDENNNNYKMYLNLCPMYLFHGDNDSSVPFAQTTTFGKMLAKYNVETYLKIYPNKTHTGPIIEDPIEGKDPLCCDILKIIYPNESLNSIVQEIESMMRGSLNYPTCILSLARVICPF